jgi:hypothetical protein
VAQMTRSVTTAQFPKLCELKMLVAEKKFEELSALKSDMNAMSDTGLNLGIWDGKLITKLDRIFAEIYFISAGKKELVLHPTFAMNTDEGYKMWTKYHTRVIETIIQFESDTTGHRLPVGFAVRVYLMLFWNCSGNETHLFPLFSGSNIEAYEQILRSVENAIVEVRHSSIYLPPPSPSVPVCLEIVFNERISSPSVPVRLGNVFCRRKQSPSKPVRLGIIYLPLFPNVFVDDYAGVEGCNMVWVSVSAITFLFRLLLRLMQ